MFPNPEEKIRSTADGVRLKGLIKEVITVEMYQRWLEFLFRKMSLDDKIIEGRTIVRLTQKNVCVGVSRSSEAPYILNFLNLVPELPDILVKTN